MSEDTTTRVRLVTAYESSKIVNAALKEAGIDKKIPPQMMYRYAAQNYIPTFKGLVVLNAEFTTWLENYVNNTTARSKKAVERLAIEDEYNSLLNETE